MQLTSAVILLAAKSEKIFQDAIMLAILKIDLFSKMLPLGCVDYDYLKGLKKLVPRASFSYIGTWEFF